MTQQLHTHTPIHTGRAGEHKHRYGLVAQESEQQRKETAEAIEGNRQHYSSTARNTSIEQRLRLVVVEPTTPYPSCCPCLFSA